MYIYIYIYICIHIEISMLQHGISWGRGIMVQGLGFEPLNP